VAGDCGHPQPCSQKPERDYATADCRRSFFTLLLPQAQLEEGASCVLFNKGPASWPRVAELSRAAADAGHVIVTVWFATASAMVTVWRAGWRRAKEVAAGQSKMHANTQLWHLMASTRECRMPDAAYT
jgi:hypothetical protein